MVPGPNHQPTLGQRQSPFLLASNHVDLCGDFNWKLLVYVPLFGLLFRLAYQTSELEKLKNLNPEVFSKGF